MSPPRGPRLPQEVFNMIIDDDPEDNAMQKTYALVSKAFLAHSRNHFFHAVDFFTIDGDAMSRALHARFHEILKANPTIATYVREVRVRDISEELDLPEDERPSWIRDEVSFHQTLVSFAQNGISRFTLKTDLYWTSFPAGLKRSLMAVFLSPSLVYLGFTGMQSFPRSCCAVFRRVQELYLDRVELDEDDDGHEDRDVAVPQIRPAVTSWLGFENMTGTSLRILLDALSPLRHLEVLHVGPHRDEEVEAIWEMVRVARVPLRQFFWTYTQKENMPPPLKTSPINLVVTNNLRWLYFEVTPLSQGDHFCGLLALLASFRSDNELRILHIAVYYLDYAIALLSVSEYDGWGRLNALLGRFHELDDMCIELYVCGLATVDDMDPDVKKKELEQHVRLRLADQLDLEEILYVSVIDHHARQDTL